MSKEFVPMVAWDVFLYGSHIDIVFWTPDSNEEMIRQSLIENDGYDPDIEIAPAWRGNAKKTENKSI